MKILILHNNNLPDSISQLEVNEELETTLIPLTEPPTDRKDFDTFVSESLSEMNLEQYDIIVLPLNFTETYLEFTGLRVAAHIRLTPDWNCLSTPILFWGIDKVEDILRFNILGEILNTYNIYYTQEKGADALLQKFKYIDGHHQKDISTSSIQYKHFLERMKLIPAPSNYTTHHSVANEWAIMRWANMLNWGKLGKPELPNCDFMNMLYYKYLKASLGVDENFDNTDKNLPKIPNIDGKRIMLIDDEWGKGWYTLLKRIIEVESGAKLVNCDLFDKNKTKRQLIEDINNFIQDKGNEDIDCYIVDLRLHDKDFDILENDVKDDETNNNLTGIQIIQSIKKINPGNQVVYFTASNKVWNFKNASDDSTSNIIGNNFALKESPEQHLSDGESYKYYCQFISAVQHACKMSRYKTNFSIINEKKCKNTGNYVNFTKIDLFNRLIILNDGKKKGDLIDSAALCLSSFLESHIKEKFELKNSYLYSKRDNKPIGVWVDNFKFEVKKEDGRPIVLSMDYNEYKFYGAKPANQMKLLKEGERGWFYPRPDRDITLVVVTLKLYYDFSNDTIKDYIELKIERNKNIAHGANVSSISADFLQNNIFENIVVRILKKDIDSAK